MKGNQGLEALAALCGGRPKAIDRGGANAPPAMPPSTCGSMKSPSLPPRSSSSSHTSFAGRAMKSPSPVASAAAQNHMFMRQAIERGVAEAASGNGSVPARKQQHNASGPVSVSTDALTAPGSALNFTPQQISQAILVAANSQAGRLDPALAQSMLYPAAPPVPAVSPSNNNLLANTMQQLVLQQYLQAQANAQQQAQAVGTNGHSQAALLAMTLAAGKASQPQQHFLPIAAPAPITATAPTTSTGPDPHRSSHGSSGSQQQQHAQAQALLQHAAQQQQQQLNTAFTSIKPATTAIHQQHAQALQQQYHFQNGTPAPSNGATTSNMPSMIKIAAAGGRILPSTEISPKNSAVVRNGSIGLKDGANNSHSNAEDHPNKPPAHKKQQKRAANRRSAQLSRKRKKQFIEELKEENDDLRRKEQILRAIPDLIVVFDSSGRLGFVSESVGRFLNVDPDMLEGTSFWELICEESVRMLKAAFMDSLAARKADSDTAVLGSGVWELRLKDKHSKYLPVTLNGVVHFKGDAPECVCCIRPLGEDDQSQKQKEQKSKAQQQKQPSKQPSKMNGLENSNNASGDRTNKNNCAVSCSDGDASRSSYGSNATQQSVLNSRHGQISMSEQDEAANDAKKRNKKFRRFSASADDGDNQNSDHNKNNNNNINLDADGTNNSVRISDGDSNDGLDSDQSDM